MKKILLFALLLCNAPLFAQTVYNLDAKKVKTIQDCSKNAVVTKAVATYKNQRLSVYQTKKGKLFCIIPSKKGGYYRKYIN